MENRITGIYGKLDKISFFLHMIGSFCIICLAVLVVVEIISRVVFGHSFEIAWETGSYLLGASWFLAAGYTLRTQGHVRISIIAERISDKNKRILDIIATIIGLVICIICLIALSQLFVDSITFQKISYTPLQTPLMIPQFFIVLGMAVMTMQMALRLTLLSLNQEPNLTLSGNSTHTK